MQQIIANRYSDRKGGYVRILKNGYRASGSDRAPLALIELVPLFLKQVNNPNDVIYHLAQKHIPFLEKQLVDIESKKYNRKVVKLWNMETGKKEECVQLLPRHDLTPEDRSRLSKSENALRKRLMKYRKSINSFPAARDSDATNFALTDGSIPLLRAPKKVKEISKPVVEKPLEHPATVESEKMAEPKSEPSKSFMEKYFGRFWKSK